MEVDLFSPTKNESVGYPPPSHLTSDYITIAYHCVFVLIGVPLNAFALRRELPTLASNFVHRRVASSSCRFALVKFHLIVSDFMILLVYSVSTIVWTSIYTWKGGDFLCRTIKFFHLFVFSLHANVIVVIAVERLLEVRQMRAVTDGDAERRRLHVMLAIGWLLAALCSVPQLFVWRVGVPFEGAPKWTQCATLWQFQRHDAATSWVKPRIEVAYNVAHMLVLFCLPTAIIFCCYTTIFVVLARYVREQRQRFRRHWPIIDDRHVTTPVDHVTITCSTHESPQLHTRTDRASRKSTARSSLDIVDSEQRSWTHNFCSRTLRQTMLIVVAYVLFWSPYCVLVLLAENDATGRPNGKRSDEYLHFLYSPIVLNAVVDPLLYRF